MRDQRSGALLLSAGVFTGARCGSGFRCLNRLRAENRALCCAPLLLWVVARLGIAPRAKIFFFFHPSLGWIPKELKLSGISFCFAKAALGTEFSRLKRCYEASLVFSVPSGLDRCVFQYGGRQGFCRRRSTEECALRVINLNLNLVIWDACFCFLNK